MSKREIASLACKIIGVVLIIQGLNVLGNILALEIISGHSDGVGTFMFLFMFLILFGIGLWFLSDKLSIIMIKDEDEITSDKNLGIAASDLQRILFSTLGLFFIGNSIPVIVLNLVHTLINNELYNNFAIIPNLAGDITKLAIGLGILFGSEGLVNLLNACRTAGWNRDDEID